MQVTKKIRDEYETILRSVGESGLYSNVLCAGILHRKHIDAPELMMMDQSDSFFSLYRTTGNENYFVIGRVLRRVAHRLYRESMKLKPITPRSNRFLNIVK
jgi:hypothetical protein